MILGVLLLVLNVAALHITSQNWFCGSACHIMETYHASWQASGHKDVDCVECHIPPGAANLLHAKVNGMGQLIDDLLGRTSGKPSAAVSDFSCTRSGCHDLAQVRQAKVADGPYLFRHDRHLDKEFSGIQIHCTTCHSHIQGSQHFQVNTNACVVCHLMAPARPEVATVAGETAYSPRGAMTRPGGAAGPTAPSGPVRGTRPTMPAAPAGLAATFPASAPAGGKPTSRCRDCHVPPAEPVELQGYKVVHSEFAAYGAACESCHVHVTAPRKKVEDSHCFHCHDFGLERMVSTEQVHRQHSNTGHKKVECFSCHGVIQHGPVAQAMRLDVIDCRACHRDQHSIQQTVYKSVLDPKMRTAASVPRPATGPASAPSSKPSEDLAITPMFLAHVHCTGCHVKQTAVGAKPDSGATVAVATPQACDRCHKAGLGEKMVPMWQRNAKEYYGVVSGMLKAVPPDVRGRPAEALAEARRLLELVRLDGSWGVHNPRYTAMLLDEARKKVLEATPPAPRETGEPKGSP